MGTLNGKMDEIATTENTNHTSARSGVSVPENVPMLFLQVVAARYWRRGVHLSIGREGFFSIAYALPPIPKAIHQREV
jgi:hypothetical protein